MKEVCFIRLKPGPMVRYNFDEEYGTVPCKDEGDLRDVFCHVISGRRDVA